MKIMKKLFRYLVLAAAASTAWVGCSDNNDDMLSTQNKDKEKPVVSVSTSLAGDNDLTITLTASDNAHVYGYAFYKGTGNTVPDAYSIVANEISSSACMQKKAYAVSADDAGSKVTVIKIAGLDLAANYQIFTAAITETGLLSEVVTTEVKTLDSEKPVMMKSAGTASKVTLTFSESVTLAQGGLTYDVLAWGIEESVSVGNAIPNGNISASGTTVTVTLPEPLSAGAGAMLHIPAGAFKDASGNDNVAVASTLLDKSKNPIALPGSISATTSYSGIYWEVDTQDFPIEKSYFEEQPEDADYNTPTTPIVFAFPFDVYVDEEVSNPISVVFDESMGSMDLYAEWTLGDDKRTVTVTLPKVPTGKFDVKVAAGLFYDIWGNASAAFSTTPYRYSNFQVQIKEGDYTIQGKAWGSSYVENPNSGKPFKANLSRFNDDYFTLKVDWFGAFGGYAQPNLVGTVDYANNRLVFDGTMLAKDGTIYSKPAFGMGFYYYDAEGETMLVFWGGGDYGTDPVYCSFDEDGYLTDISECAYYVHDASNGRALAVFDELSEGKMTFVPADGNDTVAASLMSLGTATRYKALPAPTKVSLKR